ncbi:MAG: hypothetical protein GY856_29000 [bacterium]|nr:hypothetical protein [bacterium]
MKLELKYNLPFVSASVRHQGIVYNRVVDHLSVAEAFVSDFAVEIGGMDYGFEIQGIIGMDFLQRTGSMINLNDMTIDFS